MRYEVPVQNLGKLAESFRSFCGEGLEFLRLTKESSKVVLEGASKGEEKEFLVDGEKKPIKDVVEFRVVRDKVRIFSYENDVTFLVVNTGFWSVYAYSSSKETFLEAKALKPEKDNALSTFSFQVRNIDFPITSLKKEEEVYGIGVKNEEVFKHLPGIQDYSQVIEKLFTTCDFKEIYGLCESLVKAYVKTWEEKASMSFWQRFVNSELTSAYLFFLEGKEANKSGRVVYGRDHFEYSWHTSNAGVLFSLYGKGGQSASWCFGASFEKVNEQLFPKVDKAMEEEFKNGIGSLISWKLRKQNRSGFRR